MKVDRKEFYEVLWTTQTREVLKLYGITHGQLKKTCYRHAVPRPPSGYWTNIHSGKPVQRIPLPGISDPQFETIAFGVSVDVPTTAGDQDDTAPHQPSKAVLSDLEELLRAERQDYPFIKVAKKLVSDSPLIARTSKSLLAAGVDHRGRVKPEAKKALDVEVGPKSVNRAMRIMDAILKAFDARGFRVRVGVGDACQTQVVILGEAIPFRLEEKFRRVEQAPKPHKGPPPRFWDIPPVKYEYFLTDELHLKITKDEVSRCRRQWKDSKVEKLERCLNEFVVGTIKVVAAARDYRASQAQVRKEWEAKKREQEALERQRREEDARIRKLDSLLASWEKAQSIRSFVAAVRRRAEVSGRDIKEGSDLWRWLAWAERRADAIDPSEDPLSVREEPRQYDRPFAPPGWLQGFGY